MNDRAVIGSITREERERDDVRRLADLRRRDDQRRNGTTNSTDLDYEKDWTTTGRDGRHNGNTSNHGATYPASTHDRIMGVPSASELVDRGDDRTNRYGGQNNY